MRWIQSHNIVVQSLTKFHWGLAGIEHATSRNLTTTTGQTLNGNIL